MVGEASTRDRWPHLQSPLCVQMRLKRIREYGHRRASGLKEVFA